jgi:hypothetical protein
MNFVWRSCVWLTPYGGLPPELAPSRLSCFLSFFNPSRTPQSVTVHYIPGMIDFIPPIEPPIPEPPEPKARIALWMHDDDWHEQYYVNAIIWREEMRRKYPEDYRRSHNEIAAPVWLAS